MTHEYDDPFSPEAIDAAVIRVLELRRETPAVPLDEHVEAAVHEQEAMSGQFASTQSVALDRIRTLVSHSTTASRLNSPVNRRFVVLANLGSVLN
jgi:hypothetical protein